MRRSSTNVQSCRQQTFVVNDANVAEGREATFAKATVKVRCWG
jgi:hypothetical protein